MHTSRNDRNHAMTISAHSSGGPTNGSTSDSSAGTVLETLFTTEGLSSRERLAHFDQFLTRSKHGTRVLSRCPELFAARVRAVQLGSIEVSELTAANATVARTPALIRASDPDVYAFIAPLSGQTVLSQAGRDIELRPGWMALRSSGRPFEVHIAAQHGPARLIRAQVPRSLLAQQRPQLDRLLAEPVPGRGGMASVFTQFLTGLASGPADQGGDYRPGDLPRLGNLTLDMFDAVLAHVLDPDLQVLPGQQGLLSQVVAYIREHLGDPELSPDTVAAAHHISVSYLHRLFGEPGPHRRRHHPQPAARTRAARPDRSPVRPPAHPPHRRTLGLPRPRHLHPRVPRPPRCPAQGAPSGCTWPAGRRSSSTRPAVQARPRQRSHHVKVKHLVGSHRGRYRTTPVSGERDGCTPTRPPSPRDGCDPRRSRPVRTASCSPPWRWCSSWSRSTCPS